MDTTTIIECLWDYYVTMYNIEGLVTWDILGKVLGKVNDFWIIFVFYFILVYILIFKFMTI